MIRVAIIGSGPSALFASKTILENSSNIVVHVYERGHSPENRHCPMGNSSCHMCENCDVLNGGGGAGLYSDGKLVLDLRSGGDALGISGLTNDERKHITESIKDTFLRFDGVSELKDAPPEDIQKEYSEYLSLHDLKIKYYSVMHMGTSNLGRITHNFMQFLMSEYERRIDFNFNTYVTNIEKTENGKYILTSNKGKEEYSSVIAAVGKSGADWLKQVLLDLNCDYYPHNYYFGVRMETKASHIKNLVKYSFDPKIYRVVNSRKVKLHCVCRNGDVRFYRYKEMLFVGGHSPYTKSSPEFLQMDRANFNVMLSFNKTKLPPNVLLKLFRESTGGKVIAQRFDDFRNNKATNVWGEMVPKNNEALIRGNIRDVLDAVDPEFSNILINFINDLSKISSGINNQDNILYSPAIEWNMDTVKVDLNMETEQRNLFAIGDGAGISQGIVYSAATGIVAAREIVSRFAHGDLEIVNERAK